MSDELATAELTLRSFVRKQPHDPLVEEIGALLAGYDRRRTENGQLRVLVEQEYQHGYADGAEESRADLARALPVVEAAGAVEAKWESMRSCYSSTAESVALAELLDTLVARVWESAGEQ